MLKFSIKYINFIVWKRMENDMLHLESNFLCWGTNFGTANTRIMCIHTKKKEIIKNFMKKKSWKQSPSRPLSLCLRLNLKFYKILYNETFYIFRWDIMIYIHVILWDIIKSEFIQPNKKESPLSFWYVICIVWHFT